MYTGIANYPTSFGAVFNVAHHFLQIMVLCLPAYFALVG
jgi:hypothetical protein